MRLVDRPLDDAGLPQGYPLQPDWELTPRQVKALCEQDACVVLDVREPAEVAAASLEDALVIPIGEVRGRLTDLEAFAEDPLVVICHHGARSMQVTAFLRQQGFDDVKSMAGGIDLWSRDIDPTVPRY